MFRVENDPILDLVCGGGVEAGAGSTLPLQITAPGLVGLAEAAE